MKSQIVRKILFLILLVILYNVQVFGQGASSSNPIEYTAIGEGEALLSKQINRVSSSVFQFLVSKTM